MIHNCAKKIEREYGFNKQRKLIDDCGCVGYLVSHHGERYSLVAKEYAYKNLASFMKKIVVTAPKDIDFIFYCADEDRFTVFNGPYYKENATLSQGDSKKREEIWLELNRSHGCELSEFLSGSDSYETLAGENKTLGAFC